ncbi:Ca2+-binding RTX toxin-like protein [Actinoplanes lutulentus]|uniref:Hemolysin type calcium-binding protein n=1 Tax=Actinoplanes lutulentus TaxID=1287878 RepID=A0A327YYS7_9ACTN|nr:calcium-binding protein [Actinoplanes lutulentus]MBB2943433.1 Ca2+-binding RTX toxin-like protein [Actinoplanes lutulentus]RAK26048.1 hemolysin type calcium-binding protein [Actinoplanes lutulentus]
MFSLDRKKLAAIGVAAGLATAFFASPAQAATAAKAEVLGESNTTVRFAAAAGQVNSLVITVSGRTVTLNDKVAIKAGKGCKAVKGDKTKVKCTTAKKPTELSVTLGNKNDTVTNKTGIALFAEGGTGKDVLRGGSGADTLFGGAGNDKIYGYGGADNLQGSLGNDTIRAGRGNDYVEGGPGKDKIYGDAGNDDLIGGVLDGDAPDSDDVIHGGTGNDYLLGGYGNDSLYGNAGNDNLAGGSGKDKLVGGAGTDTLTQ